MDDRFTDFIEQETRTDANMEELRPTPIYQFNPNQLQEVRKLFGFEDVKILNETLDQFEDWIKKQNHFAVTHFDRDYLERFIMFNKGSLERSKRRFDKMCTMRSLMPELMGEIDVRHEFNTMLSMTYMCIFPKPTKDHVRVLYNSFTKDQDGFDLLNYYRYMITTMQYGHFNEYCSSLEIIIDVREMSLSMLSKLNPIIGHKGITLMTDAYGFRMKALHLICASKFVDTLVMLFKRTFSPKLGSRIHVHSSCDTLKDFIDESILPIEIGGKFDKTLKEISEDVFKQLSSDSHLAHMKFMEKAVTDESRRLTSTFNEEYSGMPGSFRSFCVD